MSNPHFTLVIEMKGAAYDEDPEFEIKRALARTSNNIDHYGIEIGAGTQILDTNGNTVGYWRVTNGDFAEGPS